MRLVAERLAGPEGHGRVQAKAFRELAQRDLARDTLLTPLIETAPEVLADAPGGTYGKLLLRRGRAAEARRWLLDAADSEEPEVRDEALMLLREIASLPEAPP
jgi:hypothetical protein